MLLSNDAVNYGLSMLFCGLFSCAYLLLKKKMHNGLDSRGIYYNIARSDIECEEKA